jgi:hypothetical protein
MIAIKFRLVVVREPKHLESKNSNQALRGYERIVEIPHVIIVVHKRIDVTFEHR